MPFDPTSEQGKVIVERLNTEEIIWNVTVAEDGTPRPVPVWFSWDGSSIVIYSKDDLKVKALKSHPQAALHLNSDEHGGQVVIFYGTLAVDDSVPNGVENTPYLDKYREGMKAFIPDGGDETDFFKVYSVKLRFTINGINAW